MIRSYQHLWNEITPKAIASSIEMDTPYYRIYEKNAGPSHLRIIGSKAFFHVKGPEDKIPERAW